MAAAIAVLAPAGQQALFTGQMLADLGALQRICTSPMEASFIRNVVDAVRTGRVGNDAVQFATEETLSDRLLCNYRQVEEHVHRDDSLRSAHFVRNRLEVAHGKIDLTRLARAALRIGEPLPRRSRASFTNLDAGVPL